MRSKKIPGERIYKKHITYCSIHPVAGICTQSNTSASVHRSLPVLSAAAMAVFLHFPARAPFYRVHNGSQPGLFYDDTRVACSCLCTSSLCPAIYHRYFNSQRQFGVQLPGTITQGYAMDTLCSVCFYSYSAASWLYGLS